MINKVHASNINVIFYNDIRITLFPPALTLIDPNWLSLSLTTERDSLHLLWLLQVYIRSFERLRPLLCDICAGTSYMEPGAPWTKLKLLQWQLFLNTTPCSNGGSVHLDLLQLLLVGGVHLLQPLLQLPVPLQETLPELGCQLQVCRRDGAKNWRCISAHSWVSLVDTCTGPSQAAW